MNALRLYLQKQLLEKSKMQEKDPGEPVYNKKTCIKEGEAKTVKLIRVLLLQLYSTSQQGFNSCRNIDFRE